MGVRVTRTAMANWQGDLPDGGGRIGVGSGAYEGPFTLRARVDDVERSTNPEELIGRPMPAASRCRWPTC